jgi:DNA-directed RNA polymerase specialized sigma24 family protein
VVSTRRRTTRTGRNGIAKGQLRADHELLEHAALGDREAWEDFRERHALLLFAYLSAMVGDPRAAEHLMDETLLRAWCEANRFNASGNIDAASWLLGVARNVLAVRRA